MREAFGNLSAREGWEKLPRYALGASSGASMVRRSLLPLHLPECMHMANFLFARACPSQHDGTLHC